MNDSQIGKNDGLGRVFYNFRSSTNLIEHTQIFSKSYRKNNGPNPKVNLFLYSCNMTLLILA